MFIYISILGLPAVFFHWNISVICFTAVLQLATTVFFSIYFQTFWPKWLKFFVILETLQSNDWKKQLTSLFERAGQCYTLMPATIWVISFRSTPQHFCFQIPLSKYLTLHHWIFFTCFANWLNPIRNCCVFIHSLYHTPHAISFKTSTRSLKDQNANI